MRNLRHIFHLGIKEILSLARDPVLLFLIAYCFTFSVYTPAKSAVMDVINASIAMVDEDDSALSRQIRDALLPPLFRPARLLDFSQINNAMNSGQFTFIIDLPRKFQRCPSGPVRVTRTTRSWSSSTPACASIPT